MKNNRIGGLPDRQHAQSSEAISKGLETSSARSGSSESSQFTNEKIAPVTRVLDVHETAEFLRISESIIRRLIREHRIPYFQIEGRYLFYLPALESWIEDKMVPPTGNPAVSIAEGTANEIWQLSKRN
jgi:excisionase family DNA binding protein